MAKDKKSRLLMGLANAFELPTDVVLDHTRTTITGNHRVLIENHKGILSYEPEKIRIRTETGETVITGARMRIDALFTTEIAIRGLISGIEFLRRGSE